MDRLVPEILFVVGEASGDLHAGKVAEALHVMAPELAMVGIGGGHMRAAGVEILEDVENLAVMGFAEVVRHIPKHYALLGRLRARIQSGRVALVVLFWVAGLLV